MPCPWPCSLRGLDVHLPEKADKLDCLQVDSAKYLCLKAITLFTPSAVGLSDPVHMENLQEKAQVVLTKYMQAQYLSQHQCYWHLLLWLPTLRTVTVSLISLCSSYIWWVRL